LTGLRIFSGSRACILKRVREDAGLLRLTFEIKMRIEKNFKIVKLCLP